MLSNRGSLRLFSPRDWDWDLGRPKAFLSSQHFDSFLDVQLNGGKSNGISQVQESPELGLNDVCQCLSHAKTVVFTSNESMEVIGWRKGFWETYVKFQ